MSKVYAAIWIRYGNISSKGYYRVNDGSSSNCLTDQNSLYSVGLMSSCLFMIYDVDCVCCSFYMMNNSNFDSNSDYA